MRIIVAYDRYSAKTEEKVKEIFKNVLSIIIEKIRSEKLLMNVEDQFFYTLNTTIEIETPATSSETDIKRIVAELEIELKEVAQVRVGFGCMTGDGDEGLNQKHFYETVNYLVQAQKD